MKKQTIFFNNGAYIAAGASVVGKKEGEGPLGECFDLVLEEDKWGEDSFEKAERKMFKRSLEIAKHKSGFSDYDLIIGGDLLNQIISASFAAKDFNIPFLGIYGACSTMTESMLLGAAMVDAGFCEKVLCAASSHFSSAERQYRFPLEYGNQRTPTAQWTVTGAGCTAVCSQKTSVRIVAATIGRIVDMGVTDVNNMGAAMAPAAADTLTTFMQETNSKPDDFDLIVTGDLGKLGKEVLTELMDEQGYNVRNVLDDCGCMIFREGQDTHMGGSGCGCSASVFNGLLLNKLAAGKLKNILFAATGALLSPTSSFQGENIPGICYAVNIKGV